LSVFARSASASAPSQKNQPCRETQIEIDDPQKDVEKTRAIMICIQLLDAQVKDFEIAAGELQWMLGVVFI